MPDFITVIPIPNSPIFPGMIAPIILSEEKFTSDLEKELLKSGVVALNLVKPIESQEESPLLEEKQEVFPDDLYQVGVLCKIVKKLKLPDGSVNILVHGFKRYRALEIKKEDRLISTEL